MDARVCMDCGYDMQAHQGWVVRCPECGKVFADVQLRPRGWWRGYLRPFLQRWCLLLAAAVVGPPAIWLGMAWMGLSEWYENWPFWFTAVFCSFPLLAAIGQVLLVMDCGRRMTWRLPPGACFLLGLATIALSVGALCGFIWLIVLATGA